MSDYLDPNNEELLKDFFVEAELQVEVLESNILVLETNPDDADAIDEIFRAAHTLKGASATVQMDELSTFTHVVEDVLDAIRSDIVAVTPDIVDTLLRSIDLIKEMLTIRSRGSVYQGDSSTLRGALSAILAQEPAPQPGGTTEAASVISTHSTMTANESSDASVVDPADAAEVIGALESGERAARVVVTFDKDNPMNTVGGIQVFAALKKVGRVLKTEPDFEALYEDNFFPTVIYYLGTREPLDIVKKSAYISDVSTDVSVTELSADPADPVSIKETAAAEPVAAPSAPVAEVVPPADATPAPNGNGASRPANQTATTSAASEPAAPASGGDSAAPAGESDDDGAERKSGGSMLRVESRRVDNLLNLVSETVINKAGFNQLVAEFGDALTRFESTDQEFRDLLKSLFDSLPGYLEQMQRGASAKQIRKEIVGRFGSLYTLHDDFESRLKASVGKFRSNAQNLGRIAGELQEGVMRIRMVPIAQIFSRFPRLVRDLSRSLEKKIKLEIEGEDTELDKSVIEDLLDPLIHCVRNSIDHGIESPADRLEAGKAEAGTVLLKAGNEGNMIVIEISDDGRGINVDKVRARAIDRGVIHPGKALTDVEAFNLIFDPGFSTAERITSVSGRGVGLDVVKRQIEKLNGTVTVWSEAGMGTRFTIKIPLTLAIIQGLLVRVGKEKYAIPITSVIDSHRIRPSDIKLIDNYEVFNVRDDVVSLIRLNRLFQISTEEQKEHHFVVIVGSGDKKMGLVVDSLIGEEDVVIKPLRDHYTNAPGIAGANITGDGTVCLIIDVSQLLELGLKHEMEQRKRRETTIR
ncbi:MAG: chemotaxis protein CheA [Spirochaetaceae bacterium]|nr:MAG: chemotaxis protein CheA [Spirochaetaceae bacterium]